MTEVAAVLETRPGSRPLSARTLDALDASIGALAVLCLVSIAVATLAGVVSRYVFSASLTWTAEAGQWLFVYLIFLGVPIAHRKRLHVSLAFLDTLLPAPLKRAQKLLVDAAVAYATIALMFGAQKLIGLIGGLSTALALPAWLQYAGIPASCAAALVYIALRDFERPTDRASGLLGVGLAALLYWMFDVARVATMPEADPVWLMCLVFLASLLLGVPVAFAMLLGVLLAGLSVDLLPTAAVVQNVVRGSSQFLLLAIPLFLLAGALMDVGGLARRLIDFARTLVRHMRAGMAQVTILAATLYGGVSGSSNANAALTARLLHPAMVKDGCRPAFSAAVCASAAASDNVIPPSVGMLIVGAATGISVGQMFVAGIVPGILFGAALMATVWLVAKREGYKPNAARASWRERARAAGAAVPVLLLAASIVVSLRFGVATPTETGALAVAFAFAVGAWTMRGFSLRALWRALSQTALDSATIGLLIGAATPFAFVLATENVPQSIAAFGEARLGEAWVVLLFLNGVLLLAGMFMDIGAAMLILTPLFLPLVERFGIEPVHFALIAICNLMIGGLTPPVGMLAYIAASVARVPVVEVFAALWPFVLALLAVLALVTYVPAVSMGLLWLGL
jgi:tripartite ATP-independent transporter DctM subunit